jgi:hypothetical protein
MSNQYKAVAAVLQNAITTINAILTSPEDEMHRIRVTNRLQQESDQLLLLTGAGDLSTGETTVLGPATTIGGKKIGKVRKFTESDLVPSDDKVHQLKEAIDDALEYFGPDASSEGILARIPELIIRGVAKKAGLKVTKDEPQEVTVDFIEEVKVALFAAGLTQRMAPIETGEKVTTEDVEKLAAAITAPVTDNQEVGITTSETKPPVDEVETPAVEQPKPDEPKQDLKPKETDTKKKTGK